MVVVIDAGAGSPASEDGRMHQVVKSARMPFSAIKNHIISIWVMQIVEKIGDHSIPIR